MKTQKQRILDLLKTRKWIPVQKLHAIGWRYGNILWVLREEGYVFKKRKQKGCRLEEWKLIKTPYTASVKPHNAI